MKPEPTLYESLGGMPALRRLSDAFYERVLADELLAPVFANFSPRHVEHVAVWLAEVFGGPEEFTTALGGHQSLLRGHLGLGIRDEHRQRWLELMSAAVDDTFPDATELHAPLMSYFEWGTAIAQEVSQDAVGTDLGDPGPTPRWGREGLQA
ncbi:group II truncated hemoglobin [Promicromonospora soli]